MPYASLTEAWGEHFTVNKSSKSSKSNKSNKRKKRSKENFKNYNTLDNNIIEQFENFTNKNSNPNTNYVYENSPLEEDDENQDDYYENTANVETDLVSPQQDNDYYNLEQNDIKTNRNNNENNIENSKQNNRINNQNNNETNVSVNRIDNNSSVGNEIREINKKINFILDKISNKNNSLGTQDNKHLYDLILFIILGVFIILILDCIVRLAIKNVSLKSSVASIIRVPE